MKKTLEQTSKDKLKKLKEEINNLSNEEKYHLANMMTFKEEEPFCLDIWDAIEYSSIEEDFSIDNSIFELNIALDLGIVEVSFSPDENLNIDDYQIL
tara:strand:+ start:202 stop:492 length:291 start_codon:yes stop_codon:yes gene_type:complete